MTVSALLGNPKPNWPDVIGAPLNGGTLTFNLAGSPQDDADGTTYTDYGALTANDNPLSLNSRGEPESSGGTAVSIYVLEDGTSYDIYLKDSAGTVIWSILSHLPGGHLETDLGSSTDAAKGDALVAIQRSDAGAIANTVHTYMQNRRIEMETDFGTSTIQLQAAINAVEADGGGYMDIGANTFDLGSVGITVGDEVHIWCAGRAATIFTYSGTGIGIDFNDSLRSSIQGFDLICSNVAATSIAIRNRCRHVKLIDFYCQGAGAELNTGIGLLIDGAGATVGFLGGTYLETYYIIQFRIGIQFDGGDLAVNTPTSTTSIGGWIIGNTAAIISGGRGIYMTALANMIGTVFIGGTIESNDVAIRHDNGGTGLDYTGDIEGNNTEHELGLSWCGTINTQNAGDYFAGGANGTINLWYKENNVDGVWTTETRKSRKHIIYDDDSGVAYWGLYRGDSLIDGNTPTPKFIVASGASADVGNLRNYYQFMTLKTTIGSAAPSQTGSTWNIGDRCWNTAPVASGTMGWVCITNGTHSSATDSTGDTDGSTAVITGMADTSDFAVNEWVTVSAGFGSSSTRHKIISLTSSTMTLDINSTSSQTDVTVATAVSTWNTFGAITA